MPIGAGAVWHWFRLHLIHPHGAPGTGPAGTVPPGSAQFPAAGPLAPSGCGLPARYTPAGFAQRQQPRRGSQALFLLEPNPHCLYFLSERLHSLGLHPNHRPNIAGVSSTSLDTRSFPVYPFADFLCIAQLWALYRRVFAPRFFISSISRLNSCFRVPPIGKIKIISASNTSPLL